MPKSLPEQLPDIVANGRKQAERTLESLETRSWVMDVSGAEADNPLALTAALTVCAPRLSLGLEIGTLPPFTAMPLPALAALLNKGDTFLSQDLQSATLFGDYCVGGAVMHVVGYNDYLARLTRCINQALSDPPPQGNRVATHWAKPCLQVHAADLTGWLDDYIGTQLFGTQFNPLGHTDTAENWRVLLLQPVVDHITKIFVLALLQAQETHTRGDTGDANAAAE